MPRPLKTGALFFLAFLGLTASHADYDLWGLLNFGRAFWKGPGFLSHDIFAYVPTKAPWIFHEWLAGLLFYPLYTQLGAWSLQLLRYALMLGALFCCLALARSRKAEELPAIAEEEASRPSSPDAALYWCWLCGACLLYLGRSPGRAQVFSFFFFALLILVLQKARQGNSRPLFLLPPVFALWANLHGGFAAGLGFFGLYLAGLFLARRPWKPFALCLFACVIAVNINPYGPGLPIEVFFHSLSPQAEVPEWYSLWQCITQGEFLSVVLLFLAAALALALMLTRTDRRDLPELAVTGAALVLGVLHVRHLPFFGLCFAAYAPAWAERLRKVGGASRRLKAAFIAFCLCVLAFSGPFWIAGGMHLLAPGLLGGPFSIRADSCEEREAIACYPIGALRFINKSDLAGKVLCQYEWGSFLSWIYYPRFLVAMDSRCETVYPEEVRSAYFDFLLSRPGEEKFLESWPPDLVLIKANTQAHRFMAGQEDFREIYRDGVSALFIREGE